MGFGAYIGNGNILISRIKMYWSQKLKSSRKPLIQSNFYETIKFTTEAKNEVATHVLYAITKDPEIFCAFIHSVTKTLAKIFP